MLVIALNSLNLAHQHWKGKKTAKRPNNFDWDCCITDVQVWMVTNWLKINNTKMEFLFVGSRQQLSKVQLESVTVEDSEISVRNLGACLTGFMWAKSAVRPCAIYIPSDISENIYQKMLPKSWVCCMEEVWGLYSYAQYTRRFSLHVFLYVSGRFNVVKNHLPSIHMYADDIQLYLSFMTLSTSPQHGALRAIQASVSDKNSWDPSTQHCFYFWPVSWSSQCWLSHLTH